MDLSPEMEIDDLALPEEVESEGDEIRVSVYEIGYHVLPTLSEEGAVNAAKDITELVKKNGGTIVGDRAPVRIPLAYTIEKRVSGKMTRFNEAYFGWVAFEAARTSIKNLQEAFDNNPSILRFLVLTTDKDAVAASLSGAVAEVPVTGDIGKPKREVEGSGEVSDVALNQALETMATEDAKVTE